MTEILPKAVLLAAHIPSQGLSVSTSQCCPELGWTCLFGTLLLFVVGLLFPFPVLIL